MEHKGNLSLYSQGTKYIYLYFHVTFFIENFWFIHNPEYLVISLWQGFIFCSDSRWTLLLMLDSQHPLNSFNSVMSAVKCLEAVMSPDIVLCRILTLVQTAVFTISLISHVSFHHSSGRLLPWCSHASPRKPDLHKPMGLNKRIIKNIAFLCSISHVLCHS